MANIDISDLPEKVRESLERGTLTYKYRAVNPNSWIQVICIATYKYNFLIFSVNVFVVSAGLVSTISILTSSDYELLKQVNLSKEECELLKTRAAKSILTSGFIPGKIFKTFI